MPRSLDPDKYPPDFLLLLDRAQNAPVIIPYDKPAGLRGYLQSFLRACEVHGGPLAEKARKLQVTAHPTPIPGEPGREAPHVLVQRREHSAYSRAILGALGRTTAEAASDAEKMLVQSLGGKP